MVSESFTYRVTDGWLRDLAAEPCPTTAWPCIDWDERVLQDQIRFLDVQSALGVNYNVVWGLFAAWAWPVDLESAAQPARMERLQRFVTAAHERGVKVLSGVGVYSWGFGEIIATHPEVAAGNSSNGGRAMCLHRPAAWDWQRRIFDFLLDPRWNLDGVSMQSADLGRCECRDCSRLTAAEYHAAVLTRSAEYLRAARPDFVIGQASWGLPLGDPADLAALQVIAGAVDYMVEVDERAGLPTRRERIADLPTAYGTVGGVFVEPPQHWDRLRWFVPCGLRSARALQRLWADGGRACEYFYRPFANPAEEVSWRTGARILSNPAMSAEDSLRYSVAEVYAVDGGLSDALTGWYARAEDAYFSRSNFVVGSGPLSLEPLIWAENPSVSGPPVYLTERLNPPARQAYARDLVALSVELEGMPLPDPVLKARTLAAIGGGLADLDQIEEL